MECHCLYVDSQETAESQRWLEMLRYKDKKLDLAAQALLAQHVGHVAVPNKASMHLSVNCNGNQGS